MRIVVVGASGGIGRSIVQRLSGEGHEVIACARRQPEGLPANVAVQFVDVEDEDTIAEAAESIGGVLDQVWVVTGMLHDASRGIGPEKALRQVNAASLATSFAVNATGPIAVAKHFVPLFSRTEPGLFAALSARVGSIGDNRLGGWYAYRAAKAALNQFLKTLAIELARTHPQLVVAGLHPGTVDTELSKPFQRGVAKLFTPDFSAERLLVVAQGLGAGDSGGVFAWDGTRIPD
ncbi:MAG: SDR family NAD(P)-dependent oxidoreductase [Myxococcota bacterium]